MNATRWKWTLIGVGLALALALALDLYPGLRGGSGWDWAYAAPQSFVPVAILALCLAVYIGGALWLNQREAVAGALVWAVAGGAILAYAAVGISAQGTTPYHLFTRTVSPVQTGASALAVRLAEGEGLGAALRDWTRVMREALDLNLIHFTTSPPGQVIVHQALADVFDAGALAGLSEPLSLAWRAYQCADVDVMRYTRGEIISAGLVGWLMPVFAALTALPLYSAGLAISGERRGALLAAQAWALTPAVLLFAPVWNTVYPLLVMWAFALLARGLARRRLIYAWAGGAVMSGATLLNFSVLPAFLLFGLYTLGYWYGIARHEDDAPGWGWTVRAGAFFGAGLALGWLVYGLAGGQTPFELFAVTLEKHRLLVQRDYFAWLILHPYDVLLFTGWGAAALALWGLAISARRARRGTLKALDVLALSMALTGLAVNVAGIVQGENARILLYYMPFFLLMGVWLYARGAAWVAPVMGVQGVWVLVMASVLAVVPLDLNPQATAPRDDIGTLGDRDSLPFITPAGGALWHSARYAGMFELMEYRYVADPSVQAITYELIWRGRRPTERPYQFRLSATAENPTDGEIIAEPLRWHAQGGNYPPTCWQADQIIRDVVVVRLPVIAEPVVWDVTLDAFDPRTGDTLPALRLEPVRYP